MTAPTADTPSRTATRSDTIRIVVVDDHQLVRDGLRALLSRHEDMEVVGEAENVAEAVRRVAFDEPHVVTMDVDLPDGSGIDACPAIRAISPETRILILTAFADPTLFRRAREQGADGFVLKRTGDFQLVEKIRRVFTGEQAFDDAPPPAARKTDPSLSRLTPREMSILELIAEGLTNREIAERLTLAEKTVKNYVSNLLAKMGVKHRAAAAAHLAALRSREKQPFPPSEWSPTR
ncbi:MAG TPA: response regulator transcription factor [Acidimicrobiia bacterium]|nr:response regulator transcription factor [Acidimicrobiia bacterium]